MSNSSCERRVRRTDHRQERLPIERGNAGIWHFSPSVRGRIDCLDWVRSCRWVVVTAILMTLAIHPVVARGASAMPPAGSRSPLAWWADYAEAYDQAKMTHKMLLVFFEAKDDTASATFESHTLANPKTRSRLEQLVRVKLPLGTKIQVDGRDIRLLDHPAFQDMSHRQGFALVDLEHEGEPYYGHVVSAFPFTPGSNYSSERLKVVLDLPPGTITQRTMIYAVRIHPERPASTWGTLQPVLVRAAQRQSQYQAQIQLQGHHNWESRFHQINSELPDGGPATEVVAESWPGEDLVEACVDCVNSWRQSPGHWGAVRARHRFFGYDIKRGGNGIWYATGIFSGRQR